MKIVTPVKATYTPTGFVYLDLPPQVIDETKVTRVTNYSDMAGLSHIYSTFEADQITVRGTPLEVMEALGLPIPADSPLPTRKQLEERITNLEESVDHRDVLISDRDETISDLWKQIHRLQGTRCPAPSDPSLAELMKRNMDQFHRTFAGPWTCAGMTTTAEPGPYSWKPSVMVSEDDLARWDKEIGWLKNLAEARRKDLDNLTRTNRKQSAEINRLKELLVGKDALITRQNAAVVAKSAEITRQSAEIIRLRKIVDDLQSHSFALAVEVANRNESFARLRESLGRFLYLGWRPDHPSYKVAARLAWEALTEGC